EAQSSRWEVASPYSFPGRAKLQSTLMRGSDRIFLAGDFMGTLYTESSIMSAFSAAQSVASVLATQRQSGSYFSDLSTAQLPTNSTASSQHRLRQCVQFLSYSPQRSKHD